MCIGKYSVHILSCHVSREAASCHASRKAASGRFDGGGWYCRSVLRIRGDEVKPYENKSVCSRTSADKLLFCDK